MGTAAASAGAAGPSEGLRAGRRTKPEYTTASGRRDHATFGSEPTRQSDERDSEPDYLLRPDEARAVWFIADYRAFLFRAQVAYIGQDLSDSKESSSTPTLEELDVTFESVIKEAVAFATSSAITHIPCAKYSRSPVTEKDSRRAIAGSTESHQLCYAVCNIRSIGEKSGSTTGRLGSTGLQAMPSEGRHSWHSGAHPPPSSSPGRVTLSEDYGPGVAAG